MWSNRTKTTGNLCNFTISKDPENPVDVDSTYEVFYQRIQTIQKIQKIQKKIQKIQKIQKKIQNNSVISPSIISLTNLK